MKNKLKGIEPIIAVVILVAVTLVIAIAVVGWIMGWWGAVGAPGESLKVTPISANNTSVSLYICNQGGAAATIQSVIIKGTPFDYGNTERPTVPAGGCKNITVDLTGKVTLTPGEVVEIQVITLAGNTYKTVVRVS